MGTLRFFLSLSVLIWHLPGRTFALVHAGVAVICFFIISGFYMALVLNGPYSGKDGVKRFYAARFFRLYPTYFVCIVFILSWYAINDVPHVFGGVAMPYAIQATLVLSNILVFGQDFIQTILTSHNFSEHNPLTTWVWDNVYKPAFNTHWMLIGQAWTLGSEILFYLIAPFVIFSIKRILILAALSLTVRFFLIFYMDGFTSEVWGYFFFPSTLVFFLLGGLSFHVYEKFGGYLLPKYISNMVVFSIIFFCIFSFMQTRGILLIERKTGYDTPSLWLVYLLFAATLPLLFHSFRDSIFDNWIGNLSYPLYLVHGMCITILIETYHMPVGAPKTLTFSVVFSLIIAYLLWRILETPIDRWRKRFRSAFPL